ncbi:MAG: DUF4349 domain-containing protein [Bacillaceae bacterium]|nr:DUF4349 domain-containing protein [Bacillaceae bacterium]
MFKKIMGCVFTLILISGCSSAYDQSEIADEFGYSESNDSEAAAPREGVAFHEKVEVTTETSDHFQAQDRMVIYQANMHIEVKEYDKVEKQIQDKVAKLNGYIVETATYNRNENSIEGYLMVKVPQESFYAFLNDVEETSINVHERQISGSDVTEEFVDLESRLKSKRVVEERLLSFMENAKKTEDLLKISADLGDVQQEIEQIVGRMNYLQNNVNYSTVTIHIQEKLLNVSSMQNPDELNTWLKAKSLFMDTVNGIITFFSGVFVIVVGLSPIIVPVGVAGLIIVYVVKKQGKQKNKENV